MVHLDGWFDDPFPSWRGFPCWLEEADREGGEAYGVQCELCLTQCRPSAAEGKQDSSQIPVNLNVFVHPMCS